VIHRPLGVGRFQFAVLSTLRAAQLMRGCRPRVEGDHKPIVTAQLEVSQGKVRQLFESPEPVLVHPDGNSGSDQEGGSETDPAAVPACAP